MTTASDRSAADWKKLDKNHYLHPFTDFKSLGKNQTNVQGQKEKRKVASLPVATVFIFTIRTTIKYLMACQAFGALILATEDKNL